MTNLINYKELPLKREFINLYVTKKLKMCDIAKRYQCTQKRIRKWILIFGLDLRGFKNRVGEGNNKKYFISNEVLERLVKKGFSNKEIGLKLNLTARQVNWLLSHRKIKRPIDLNRTTEYQKYSTKVYRLTNKNYQKYKKIINPKNYKRTLCGINEGYQLDHIRSIKECFQLGLSIKYCSSLKNLQLISWQNNLEKRNFALRIQNAK